MLLGIWAVSLGGGEASSTITEMSDFLDVGDIGGVCIIIGMLVLLGVGQPFLLVVQADSN